MVGIPGEDDVATVYKSSAGIGRTWFFRTVADFGWVGLAACVEPR
jgi:hypothetical protein